VAGVNLAVDMNSSKPNLNTQLKLIVPKCRQDFTVGTESNTVPNKYSPFISKHSHRPKSIGTTVIYGGIEFRCLDDLQLMDYLILRHADGREDEYRITKLEVADMPLGNVSITIKRKELILITPWPLAGLFFPSNFNYLITGEYV